jgi:4-hydroxybenzoate polyprenyltransferase
MKNKLITKLFGLIESMRPITSLLALSGAYIGGIVADASFYSLPLILSAVVVFLAIGGSMSFNDYYDREIDIISHPKRPIPSKRITAKESLYFSFFVYKLDLFWNFSIFSYCAIYL